MPYPSRTSRGYPSRIKEEDILKFKGKSPKDLASAFGEVYLRQLANKCKMGTGQPRATDESTRSSNKLFYARIIVKEANELDRKKSKDKTASSQSPAPEEVDDQEKKSQGAKRSKRSKRSKKPKKRSKKPKKKSKKSKKRSRR